MQSSSLPLGQTNSKQTSITQSSRLSNGKNPRVDILSIHNLQQLHLIDWDQFFDNSHMKTDLPNTKKKSIHKLILNMVDDENEDVLDVFLAAVRRSMRKRPRVTRHVLEQILPVGSFPRSIHKYSEWKKLGPLIDYIKYTIYGAPKQKFKQQMLQTYKRQPVSNQLQQRQYVRRLTV